MSAVTSVRRAAPRRFLIGSFGRAEDILRAAAAARAEGYEVVDAFTPYAVHGLDRAMGLRPSRLTFVCFAGGVAGLALAIWLEVWTSAFDWPLDVGGKPLLSFPAFVPVAFELTVLLAGLSVFLATIARSGLFPGKEPRLPLPRVTDDRFALVLLEGDAAFRPARARALLERHGALLVEEREEGARP
jgi:hypothetical protein